MWTIAFVKKDDPLQSFGGSQKTKPTKKEIAYTRLVQNAPEEEYDVFIAEVEDE